MRKAPSSGAVIFAGDIAHPDQDGGRERARDRPETADRHDDQHVDEIDEGEFGSRPTISIASAPPSPASPEPSAKVEAKVRSTLIPSPPAMRWLSTAARTCAPNRVYSMPATSRIVTTSAMAIRNSLYLPRPRPKNRSPPARAAGSVWAVAQCQTDRRLSPPIRTRFRW